MTYAVSPEFTLDSIDELRFFKKLLNCDFGYIPVSLPTLYGERVQGRLAENKSGAVYAFDESTVLKVSKHEGSSAMQNAELELELRSNRKSLFLLSKLVFSPTSHRLDIAFHNMSFCFSAVELFKLENGV